MGNSESSTHYPLSSANFAPQYEVLKKIYSPHYGDVKIIREHRIGEEMIMKDIVVNTEEAYNKEVSFYDSRISKSHPNVIRIYGYTSQDKQNFCSTYYKISVFMESLNKDLLSELQTRTEVQNYFNEGELLLLAENLVSGLAFFQADQKSHGDVRPFNIFITGDNIYKLSDPHLHPNKANALANAIIGNEKTLLAPELISQVVSQDFEIRCDPIKADVFSLGATLLWAASLSSSEDLYDYDNGKLENSQIQERVEGLRHRYSSFTVDLIQDMLNEHAASRPDFISLSNKLLPYREDILKGNNLSFYKIPVVQETPKKIQDIESTEGISKTETAPTNVLVVADGTENKSTPQTYTPYTTSTYTPSTQSYSNTTTNYGMDDLEARIKAILEQSQQTINKVLSENKTYDYTSSYTPYSGTTGTTNYGGSYASGYTSTYTTPYVTSNYSTYGLTATTNVENQVENKANEQTIETTQAQVEEIKPEINESVQTDNTPNLTAQQTTEIVQPQAEEKAPEINESAQDNAEESTTQQTTEITQPQTEERNPEINEEIKGEQGPESNQPEIQSDIRQTEISERSPETEEKAKEPEDKPTEAPQEVKTVVEAREDKADNKKQKTNKKAKKNGKKNAKRKESSSSSSSSSSDEEIPIIEPAARFGENRVGQIAFYKYYAQSSAHISKLLK